MITRIFVAIFWRDRWNPWRGISDHSPPFVAWVTKRVASGKPRLERE